MFQTWVTEQTECRIHHSPNAKVDLNIAKCHQEHQATSLAREFMNTLGTIEPWVTVAHLYLQLSQSSIWGKGYHWRKMGGKGRWGEGTWKGKEYVLFQVA